MLNFKNLKEMKKVLLFFVVAMALASCAPKKAEDATKVDSTTVKVDTAKVDTAKVDTTVKK
jgi:PBP1b-binding outer membrane lipoprotein LpoB